MKCAFTFASGVSPMREMPDPLCALACENGSTACDAVTAAGEAAFDFTHMDHGATGVLRPSEIAI